MGAVYKSLGFLVTDPDEEHLNNIPELSKTSDLYSHKKKLKLSGL
jgi:hypothetical protein